MLILRVLLGPVCLITNASGFDPKFRFMSNRCGETKGPNEKLVGICPSVQAYEIGGQIHPSTASAL